MKKAIRKLHEIRWLTMVAGTEIRDKNKKEAKELITLIEGHCKKLKQILK